MKQKLLFLAFAFLLFTKGFGQVTVVYPTVDLIQCSPTAAIFDLLLESPIILGNQNPQLYTVSFFTSEEDAKSFKNAIQTSLLQTYAVTQTKVMYVRITHNMNQSFDIGHFSLIINRPPAIQKPASLTVCDDNTDGYAPFDLNSRIAEITGGQQNVKVTFHETPEYAEEGINEVPLYFQNTILGSQVLYVRAENPVTGCYALTTLTLTVSSCVIAGTLKYDVNGNGCEATDPALENIEIRYSNSNTTTSTYTNSIGNYVFSNPLAGTGTVTPIFPSLFVGSPQSKTVNLPGEFSGTDFCITAPNTVNDVSVSLLPMAEPVPGQLASYSLVFENKGTTIANGHLSLRFDPTKMTFTFAGIPVTKENNSLELDYTDLKPFEIRTVLVNFLMMAAPTVDLGMTISVTAAIDPVGNESNLADNTFTLSQFTVVSNNQNNITTNAPGIITVAEAQQKYLTYIVRFANTGNTTVTNLRIVNTLDAHLDESTFQPVVSRYTNKMARTGNQIEYVFDNIQLQPGESGYVTYKIKAKQNIAPGDVIQCAGNIYFDGNPVVLNNVFISVQKNLGIKDIPLKDLMIYPNPASGNVVLQLPDNFVNSEIIITDILGKTVLCTTTNAAESNLNVASLNSGMYFITIKSNGKSAIQKLIIK